MTTLRDRSTPTTKDRAALAVATMALFVAAAVAPVLVGALRDEAGDFRLSFGLLGGATILLLVPIAGLARRD